MHRARPASLLFALHVVVALLYRFVGGFDLESAHPWGGWDWFWQTLRMEDLRADLLGSLWNLHSQPPLWNLGGGILGKVFGSQHLAVHGYVHILLGGLAVALCYRLLLALTHSGRVALGGGIVLALLPGFFVYEAYLLYTLPAACLVVLAIERLSRFDSPERLAPLLGFVVALNALILLRSAFHLALLGVAIPFGCVLAARHWKRFLVLAVLISIPSVGWYAKNQVKFGFFGASSWAGTGLFHVAAADASEAELAALGPMVAAVPPHSRPSQYVRFGFDERSAVPVLARDDFNNVNIPAISRAYGEAAQELIRSDPRRFLATIHTSYTFFCYPSSTYGQLDAMTETMGLHARAYTSVLTLGGLAKPRGSIYYALIPLLLLLYLAVSIRRCRLSRRAWVDSLRSDPAMAFGWFLVAYVTLVGCVGEIGENERFKFMIEPLLLVLAIALCHRVVRRGSGQSAFAARQAH